MGKTSSYHDGLIQSLADPVEAKQYLRAVAQDYPDGFLKALRNVAQAHQMSKVAQEAGIQRESLYRALSEEGNPRWMTLTSILAALGFRMTVDLIDDAEVDPTPSHNPKENEFSIGAVVPVDPLRSVNQKVVCISSHYLSLSGQNKDPLPEFAEGNEPVLQEALCR